MKNKWFLLTLYSMEYSEDMKSSQTLLSPKAKKYIAIDDNIYPDLGIFLKTFANLKDFHQLHQCQNIANPKLFQT
jgi:hypothetical protein